jgi:CHAD domain-containing protein
MIEPSLVEWAQGVVGREVDAAGEAITAFCSKPQSAKRLHRTRKRLARLRAVLEDFATLAGVSETFSQRIERLHRRAGKVRDSDVLLARVEQYMDDASPAECAELQRLQNVLRKRAKRRRRKLTRELQQ